jgi:hypothetical protein
MMKRETAGASRIVPMLKFSCPQCRQKITCDANYAGAGINCPACQQPIIVPASIVPPSIVPPGERTIEIRVSTLKKAALIGLALLLVTGIAAISIAALTKRTVLRGSERLNSPQAIRPPVEITVVAKTDSTNLRLTYAADQIIFNWERNPSELRVDGGPADGLHKRGAGHIPVGKYVTVKWLVTQTNQAIYVDGKLRFEHEGDYSQINRRVTVFTANGATVTVKSLKVKRIAASGQ